MGELKHFDSGNSAIARKVDGNPVSNAIGRFYDAFAVTLGDRAATSRRQWHMLLPRLNKQLLAYGS